MAVWEPHKLSTKLCRLFDSGLCDVTTFAKLTGDDPKLIERVTNNPGFRINRETEFRIGKVLAQYMRNFPELYHDPGPVIPPPKESKRGVVEVLLRTEDWRGFEVRFSNGRVEMYVEWPAKSVTQGRIDGLWRWLDREDPQPQLKII